jgi:signal transduction histidine kinase
MTNSLRVRFTLIFVVLAILPLIAAATFITLRAYDTLERQAVSLQAQRASEVSGDLNDFFNLRLNELTTLVDVSGFGTLDAAGQRDTLSALTVQQPAYYQFAVLDAAGQETLRLTRGAAIPMGNLADRSGDPLFQKAVESKSIGFSSVRFSDEARERLISISIPVFDLFTGTLAQVIVVDVRLQTAMEDLLRGLELGEGEDVYILDENNTVIGHRNPSYVLNDTVFDVPTAGRRASLDGVDVILAKDVTQLVDVPLTVIAEIHYQNAIALATELLEISALATIATLILAIAVITFIVTRLVQPIRKLSDVARAIQAGDFSQKAEVKSKDEIGQFASAFNAMTVAIEKRETDLREQAEELRVATAKAREAARVKGEFLANVSHELRTPLNAIIGFSDMLITGMSGQLNEKQMHKMTRLKENGMRLLNLINDLLDLTRIEAGRLETVEKAFSPRTLATRLSAQMESLATASQLKFETVIDPNLPQEVIGDEKRVEQVIVNLLSNAFKFTKEGSVTLSMDALPAENQWRINVIDTGIGIPPHAVNVIFEEFRQLDGSYSRAYKGSGLGLAITRNLVRMMGGKISVKSTLGAGSAFTVLLPVNSMVDAPAKPVEIAVG